MALEATHIRFAIDLMDKYDIQDVGAYISGTLYPDSRYVTKIERILTHDKKYLEKDFPNDDFKKGWQVHLLCDEILGKEFSDSKKTIKQNDGTWIDRTAVKILQEISDLKQFDILKYLQYSKLSAVPNNESKEMLSRYYDFMKNFYAKSNLQVEDYRFVLEVFGIPKNVENEVIAKCIELQKDKLKMRKIENLYSQIIVKAKKS